MNEITKGAMLYQMPEKIYKKNRFSGISSVYFGYIILIFGLSLTFWLLIFVKGGKPAGGFIGIIGIVAYFIILSTIKEKPINRFTIYEKGYIPATTPVIYFLKRKEYFVTFDSIKNIEFVGWGSGCYLFLKNDKKEHITIDWFDIDGYLKFMDVIKKYFPDRKYPNFDIVKESFYANQDRNNKKISLEEFFEVYNKKKEINKEFGPKI